MNSVWGIDEFGEGCCRGEGGQISEIRRSFGCLEVFLEQVGTVDDDSYIFLLNWI